MNVLEKFLSKKLKDDIGIQEFAKDVSTGIILLKLFFKSFYLKILITNIIMSFYNWLAREDLHTKSLKYCNHLNSLQSKKKYELLENVSIKRLKNKIYIDIMKMKINWFIQFLVQY